MRASQKGFSVIAGLIVIVALTLVGGVGYYIYHNDKDKKTDSSATSPTNDQSSKAEEKSSSSEPVNDGWKTYTSTTQKISFEYPEGWFVREDSETNRIYVSNHQGEFNKDNMPDDYQQLWLSTWNQEATAENESSVKNGSPNGREAGPITKGTIKAGEVTMNTYEYQTLGGSTLQAFWTANDKMYYATNSTEIGTQQQTDMVSNLKKLLPTVKHP